MNRLPEDIQHHPESGEANLARAVLSPRYSGRGAAFSLIVVCIGLPRITPATVKQFGGVIKQRLIEDGSKARQKIVHAFVKAVLAVNE